MVNIRSFRIPYQGRNIYSNVVVGGVVSNVVNTSNITTPGTEVNPEQGGGNTGGNSGGGNTTIVNNNAEWYNIHTEKRDFEVRIHRNAFTTLYDAGNWQYYITAYTNAHGFTSDKYVTVLREPDGTLRYTEKLDEGIKYTVMHFTDTMYASISKMMTIGDEITITKREDHGLIGDLRDDILLDPNDYPYVRTTSFSRLYTVVDNFSSSLHDNENYKVVLMKWKRGTKKGKDWRIPMFSPLWSLANMDGALSHPKTVSDIMWEECCWDINGNKTPFFATTLRLPELGPLDVNTTLDNKPTAHYNGLEWRYDTRQVFTQNHSVRQTFGVAIYKKTGKGRFGWQRVSNIAPVDLFLTRGNTITTCPRVSD